PGTPAHDRTGRPQTAPCGTGAPRPYEPVTAPRACHPRGAASVGGGRRGAGPEQASTPAGSSSPGRSCRPGQPWSEPRDASQYRHTCPGGAQHTTRPVRRGSDGPRWVSVSGAGAAEGGADAGQFAVGLANLVVDLVGVGVTGAHLLQHLQEVLGGGVVGEGVGAGDGGGGVAVDGTVGGVRDEQGGAGGGAGGGGEVHGVGPSGWSPSLWSPL